MSESWLHLFSSNIRPKYEQDVIDLLAAPAGTIYRFRYEDKYLGDAGYISGESGGGTPASELSVDPSTRSLFDRWKEDDLVGTKVVAYYSIQQPEGYHPSAFIPIRSGTIRRTGTDGSICFVDFEVREYAALGPDGNVDDALLTRPRPGPERTRAYGDEWRKTAIREFSKRAADGLDQHPDDLPRGRSAVIGPDPITFAGGEEGGTDEVASVSWSIHMSDRPAAWQLIVEALAKTLSFRNDLMLRFVGLCCDADGDLISADERGVFEVVGGRTYDLRFSHYHPSLPAERVQYEVAADEEILKVVGSSTISISSRYDTVSVSLHAPHTQASQETVLRLEPSASSTGAAINLRVRVKPDKSRSIGIAVGTASALILVALPGLLGDAISPPLAVGSAVTGALIAAILTAFGLSSA